MRRIGTLTIGLALLVAAAGRVYPSSHSHGASEQFQKTCTLGSRGTVSLQNLNGNLSIKAWDKNEVMIKAVKYADNQEELVSLEIEVDATGDRVAIDTKYPDESDGGHGHGAGVDYSLTIPRDAKIEKVKIVNGEIEISGVSGKVEASDVNGTIHADGLRDGCDLGTVNGNVDATFDGLSAAGDVRLKSVNGGLTLRLPDNAGADVDARVTTGRISNEFGLESSRERNRHSFVKVGDAIRGKIGNGGVLVRLETVNGSIRLLKSGSSR